MNPPSPRAGAFVLAAFIAFGAAACQTSDPPPAPKSFTLTVIKAGTGAGTVVSSPLGINCGPVCTASFKEGTVVTLTATPDAGSSFESWSGDLTGTANPGAVTMNANKTVTAAFTRIAFVISGTVRAGGAGLEGVTMAGLPGDPVTDASGAYSATVSYGSDLTVSPAREAYTFDPDSKTYANVTADQPGQDYEATLVQSSQRRALIAFFNATGGDGWTNNSGWKAEPLYPDGFAMPGTESAWFGLTLDSGTLTVTAIDLPGDNLTGTLPPELGSLTGLTDLDLSGNLLAGSIPAEVGNLTALANLNLAENPLGGPIPAGIGNLTALRYLDLDDCLLTGPIPAEVGNLTALRNLDLFNNQLAGPIPPELGSLVALQDLNLHDNLLTGSIPAEIGNLTALRYIHLSNNRLTGPIPATVGDLKELQGIYATNNQLSGPIPVEMGGLPKLSYIYLNNNKLSGPIPTEFGGMPNLRHIYLFDNELSGPIPPELGNATKLQQIVLRHNQLSGPIPVQLGNLIDLVALRLGENQLTGGIPAELGNLTKLTTLRLRDNHLSGRIPDSLGNLTQLWELLLDANQLTGPIPSSLANLTGLTATNIGHNALHSSDDALVTFLNTKDPDWAATQTIAPAEVTATSLDNCVIMVSWLPVAYTADPGYYEVLIAETLSGPFTLAGQTADKAASALNVAGLNPGQPYFFVVRTVTNANSDNPNVVESEDSPAASAVAWVQPLVRIAGTVTLDGAPLAGVVLNGLPAGTVTNALGAYAATVSAGWSGTVTPIFDGYTFDPLARSYASITTDQTAQDFTAAVVVPTIEVTAPNGGETWALGSAHAITWTAPGLAGQVTIDLYKGGAFLKNLGAAEAKSGSFSWPIGTDESVAADYKIRVRQGGSLDDSDACFASGPAIKADFNNDGQEDILWRFGGPGGSNRVWFMGNREEPGSTLSTADPLMESSSRPFESGAPGPSLVDPRDLGHVPETRQGSLPGEVQEAMNVAASPGHLAAAVDDPRRVSGEDAGPAPMADPRSVGPAAVGATRLGGADILPVDDPGWEIAAVADFDQDTHTDILWRHAPGGENVLWLMDGTEVVGKALLPPAPDPGWRIAGTGDFNNDGHTDILWRHGGGANLIWYLNGTKVVGSAELAGVTDPAWQIAGTGDFNRDGHVDVLWRYEGPGGYNVIWYLDGAAVSGRADLTPVADLSWRIAGTGDYNADGSIDILWRYGGPGGFNYIWYMDQANPVRGAEVAPVADPLWRIAGRPKLSGPRSSA